MEKIQRTNNDINNLISDKAKELQVEVNFYQSNCEGELITKIHEAYGIMDGIIINPGAYSHYSLAIHDAIKAVMIPFRKSSLPYCRGGIRLQSFALMMPLSATVQSEAERQPVWHYPLWRGHFSALTTLPLHFAAKP